MLPAWNISTKPNASLANEMLDKAIGILLLGKRIVIEDVITDGLAGLTA